MKIKFTVVAMLLLAVFSASFYYREYINANKNNQRAAYEAFLLASMKDLPSPETNLDAIPKADRPDMAAIQNYFQTLDPQLGYVPIKKQYEAYLKTKAIQKNASRNSGLYWEGTRADMGGRTRALLFDPNDPQHKKVFAAGVTGGLWYTYDITNLNQDWYPVDDFWPNLAISSLAADPVNPLIIYAGTGEAQTARVIYRESSGLGIGIMKSSDGGINWELLPSTADFAYVTDVKVRNENGTAVVYAAVVSGVYQGADHQSMPSDGLYRSADGGQSWEQVLPLIPGQNGSVYAPAQIELASNNRLFVGTMENLSFKGGATILWSDLGTSGSWTAYTNYNTLISGESQYNIPARTLVAASPSNPDIVYAQFAAGYVNGFTYYRGRYMARSTDGGQTWSAINKPANDWSTLAWHAFVLKVDPLNPSALFTGGLDLWKSTNSGQSWIKISDWALMYYGGGDEYVHADQHNIQFRPENPQQAIFSSDGGVFLSNNAQLSIPTFVERNQNFNTLQFYSCAFNPIPGSEQFLGGLQDNGTLKYTENTLTINDMQSGGDGAYCFWDQDEPNLYITSVYYNKYYFYKNNVQIDYLDAGNGTFVCPGDYDYHSNTLYANAVSFTGENPGRLLRITGIGSEMSQSVFNLGTGNSVPFSFVGLSKYAPSGTNTLFVGTQSGKLYKVTNAQSVPEVMDIGASTFPTANISSVSIGGSEDTLLVTFSNYGVSSIWQTWDGGQNWQEREGNLPDMPIRWVIYHPQNSGQAMLATESGIWTTNMLHASQTEWVPDNENMGNVRVDMLQMRENDNTVFAATHGRGISRSVWNVDIYTGISNPSAEVSISIFPNPATDFIAVNGIEIGKPDLKYAIYSISGNLISEAIINENRQINISELPSGTYLLSIKSETKTQTVKFIKK